MNCKLGWNRELTKLIVLALTILCFHLNLYSQNFRLNYLNTDNYPVIEAGFTATNSDGIKIYNSTINDFAITENDMPSRILEVVNPVQNYQPVSVVIMIDISLSMQGKRTALVKEGLVDFIDQIPLETSEIAIACFSDETYIYTDFTQSRNRLVSALNRLQTVSGTNFDRAFLDPAQGALAIGSNGRHKKMIVFITDGLGTTDAERIGEIANKMNATIFTLNINLSVPPDLKTLTLKSGGRYFERIASPAQFRSASSAIFKQMECTDYGIVKWMSRQDCSPVKSVQLRYRKALHEFDFDVPSQMVGKIEINPSLIQFGVAKAGLEQNQNLAITARNIPITLRSMEYDSLSGFKTERISLPLKLNAGEAISTKVKFVTKDAGRYASTIKLSFDECPPAEIRLHAGGEEQLKLIFPAGGEIFPIGADTSILWDGVKKTQQVDIAYRLSETHKWTNIGKGKNLSHLWNLPNDTSTKVQVRLTPLKQADENLEVTAVIESGNQLLLNTSFSPDGNRIVTTDKNGFVKTWNPSTGKILTSLGGYDAKKAYISDNDRMFLILKDELFVWNLISDKLTGRAIKTGKKVFTSFILPDGSEALTGGNVSIDPAKNARIWSGTHPYKSFLFNQPDIKWVSFTANGHLAIALDSKNNLKIIHPDSARVIHSIPLKETVTEVIISPDGSKALIRFPKELAMVDFTAGREIFRIQGKQYLQFSPTGLYLITEELPKIKTVTESATGKTMFRVASPRFLEISPNAAFASFCSQDTLYLYNLREGKIMLTVPKAARLARFNANESRLFILTNNNSLEIYETATGMFAGLMDGFSGKIREINVDSVSNRIALTMENNRIEVWAPAKETVRKDVISGHFTIASPRPGITDTIRFHEQALRELSELNFKRFAWNTGKFPVNITGMEISGADAACFGIISANFPQKIDAGAILDYEFSFTPAKTGTQKALLKTYTATDTFTTVLLGTGIKQQINPLLRHLDFGKVKVGLHKDTLAPVLQNTGADTLIFREFTNTGPDNVQFTLLRPQVYKVAPGDTLKALIRFSPLTRGKTTTLLSLTPATGSKMVVRGEGIADREIIITGVTRNSSDSVPVQAVVRNTDIAANRTMEEITTGSNGRFIFRLLADRHYAITAEKQGFISAGIQIDLTEKVPADTIKQDIYLTEIKPGAIIRFNSIFFEFNNAGLLPASQADLRQLLDIVIKNRDTHFEIHGHTDSQGPDAYNLNLSKARATTVMDYLIKNGASKDRLSVRFFGESKPVASNDTEEGRALNRRVELKVVK